MNVKTVLAVLQRTRNISYMLGLVALLFRLGGVSGKHACQSLQA